MEATQTTRTPIDHPEISAGWLSRLFYRWTGLLLRKG